MKRMKGIVSLCLLSALPALSLAQSGDVDYSSLQCKADINGYRYRVYPVGGAGLSFAVQVWTIATGKKYGEYILRHTETTPDEATVFSGPDGISYYRSLEGTSQLIKDNQNGDVYADCKR